MEHITAEIILPKTVMVEAEMVVPSGGIKGDKGDTGERGDKGDAFVYSDFTPEQLAALRGEKGDTGDAGAKGENGDAGEVPDISNLQTVSDSSLTTLDKTVVGAINELNATIGDISTELSGVSQLIGDFSDVN